MVSPRDMEDWEVPVSEIRDYTYKLIDAMGFENVRMLTERTLGTSLDAGCSAPCLRRRGFERVTTRRSQIPVAQSYAPLSRYDDKKASTERNVPRHYMRQDPHHELEDCAYFLHRRRQDEAQHYRISCDEPSSSTYINMSPVGPSGLMTTAPSQPYPPPESHHRHPAYEAAFPTSQPLNPTFAFAVGYSDWMHDIKVLAEEAVQCRTDVLISLGPYWVLAPRAAVFMVGSSRRHWQRLLRSFST
ncbi:hypothetical protein IW262DRAFT_1302222 [Armillaria fumosa]|nr:hypothetical protein IW262DRAFT_1302222 [Armillaria fumosa]